MRLASFSVADRESYGVLGDGRLREASRALRENYADLRSLLAAGALDRLRDDRGGETFSPDEVRMLPTIPNPDKVLCIGVNYRPHVEEMGRELPERPVVFVRFSGSLTGHERPLLCPRVSQSYDP